MRGAMNRAHRIVGIGHLNCLQSLAAIPYPKLFDKQAFVSLALSEFPAPISTYRNSWGKYVARGKAVAHVLYVKGITDDLRIINFVRTGVFQYSPSGQRRTTMRVI